MRHFVPYSYLTHNLRFAGAPPRRWPWCVAIMAALCAIAASPLTERKRTSGDVGYSHGTSGAIITSPKTIVAAIDSKEVSRVFRGDGTSVSRDEFQCKATPLGPFYALVAGISRSSDGFDALRFAANLYRAGDTLDEVATRLASRLPERLATILNAVRSVNGAEFDRSFRDQDVLQMSLLGPDRARPRAVIVVFRASLSASGGVGIEARQSSCPGDCRNPETTYMLGIHDGAWSYPNGPGATTEDAGTPRAVQLIQVQYARHPEFVGGPPTVIRVTGAGATLDQAGVCGTVPAQSRSAESPSNADRR